MHVDFSEFLKIQLSYGSIFQMITYCRNWLQKFRATPAGKKPIEIKTTEAQVDPKYVSGFYLENI